MRARPASTSAVRQTGAARTLLPLRPLLRHPEHIKLAMKASAERSSLSARLTSGKIIRVRPQSQQVTTTELSSETARGLHSPSAPSMPSLLFRVCSYKIAADSASRVCESSPVDCGHNRCG